MSLGTIRRSRQGFTLIEIAIVLILIGIIIGAVIKGKDLIRSAEQKKIYSKFLNEWKTAYLAFYDRTGRILGDTYDGSFTGQDGKADTGGGASRRPTDNGRDALFNGQNSSTPKFYGLRHLGLEAPQTNTDKSWKYRYTDSTGQNHDITVAFAYDTGGKYNYMLIEDIPNELAIAMDRLIDSQTDGLKGDFIGNKRSGEAWGVDPEKPIKARWKMQF